MKKTERKTRPAPSASKAPRSAAASLPSDSGEPVSQSFEEIKALIELVARKQITEFELERGDFRLRIHRGTTKSSEAVSYTVSPQMIMPPAQAFAPAPPEAPRAAELVAVPVAAPAPAEENLHIITSPIVGTFYRSSSPTAEPFVKIGDVIVNGKPLCIIEAMKLMNEITAEVSGTIVKILVENGQPIEYGQPLFGVRL